MPFRQFAGSPFAHLITRGVERRWIYESESQRWRLFNLLGESSQQHGVSILSFALMSNHYHLIVRADRDSISKMMRRINRSYSVHFNNANQRVGTLYQGRYKSFGIRSAGWLLSRTMYVNANPTAARICMNPAAYPWSSAGAYLGTRGAPPWLIVEPVLSILSRDLETARARYADGLRAFVVEQLGEKADAEFTHELPGSNPEASGLLPGTDIEKEAS